MQSDHLLRAAKDSLPMPRKYKQIHFVLGKIGLYHFHSAGKHDRGPLFFTLFFNLDPSEVVQQIQFKFNIF